MTTNRNCNPGPRKPSWLKRSLPTGHDYESVRKLLKQSNLNTVCQEAKCPNMWECFSRHTSTFMIMGSQCTRNCRFCNVKTGTPLPLDSDEPLRVAKASLSLGLKYVVVTSVTRDDLQDGGAAHFAATIKEIKKLLPEGTKVEVLIPDFQGDKKALETVMMAGPDVLNHNIETVPSLYATVRPEAEYERSLELLKRASSITTSKVAEKQSATNKSKSSQHVKSDQPRPHAIPVKSGIMVGLGETREELEQTIKDLFFHGCTILTIGQYLQPSKKHLDVARFYTPEEFESLKIFSENIGFDSVASGPFVRSSYEADKLCRGGK
ncbi:lipoate synthase [Desulfamplus magnetovallimortis]|uniref:Lipoyl synthase n=1 Tax=Desulfamplus magnetovallimortis TaxID=1246637 RepID=A0A1W1HAQ6_9BACT|nr:lipoyl synthase [Desulfamplus magnetovallimortis]SLM29458.1 lipoate synthase [Desulfamplus magnetovallimortis]